MQWISATNILISNKKAKLKNIYVNFRSYCQEGIELLKRFGGTNCKYFRNFVYECKQTVSNFYICRSNHRREKITTEEKKPKEGKHSMILTYLTQIIIVILNQN
jgi:hypothetical protein